MKIYNSPDSKKRFVEMFQRVNKITLNEDQVFGKEPDWVKREKETRNTNVHGKPLPTMNTTKPENVQEAPMPQISIPATPPTGVMAKPTIPSNTSMPTSPTTTPSLNADVNEDGYDYAGQERQFTDMQYMDQDNQKADQLWQQAQDADQFGKINSRVGTLYPQFNSPDTQDHHNAVEYILRWMSKKFGPEVDQIAHALESKISSGLS